MSDPETDLEAVEACQFEPRVYHAMSDHNCGGEERLYGTDFAWSRAGSIWKNNSTQITIQIGGLGV